MCNINSKKSNEKKKKKQKEEKEQTILNIKKSVFEIMTIQYQILYLKIADENLSNSEH